jgi:nicotinamide riboside kinase
LNVIKIAILGAECSGKSTLTRKLAIKNHGIAVFEYLRHYCNSYRIPQHIGEQLYIAYKQIELEKIATQSSLQSLKLSHLYHNENTLIFCDTSPLLIYVYTLYYFKIDDIRLRNLVLNHQYSYQHTIILSPLKWIADGQRDSPQAQLDIYNLLLDIIDRFNIKVECLTDVIAKTGIFI